MTTDQPKNWVRHVMETSFATSPPPGVFTRPADDIVSAATPDVAPGGLRSWQRMVLFHKNRGGKRLPAAHQEQLALAIKRLSEMIAERKALPGQYDPNTLYPLEKESAYAPGIPSKDEFGDHTRLPVNELVDYVVQQHDARRAGRHYDVRMGTPDTGLLSFVTRKGMPAPGEKRLLVQQPLHDYGYKDFEGSIEKGYGAGEVKTHDKGRLLITKVGPGEIHFTSAHRNPPERFAMFRKPDGKNWLAVNVTPTDPVEYEKTHFASVPADEVDKALGKLGPGGSVQAKVDGAATLMRLMTKHVDLLSYRRAKRPDSGGNVGNPIVHTERAWGGRPEVDVPKELRGAVLRAETYGTRDGIAVPPQELGGILNATVGNSLDKQKAQDVQLHNMVFDVHQLGKKKGPMFNVPYQDRLAKVREILKHLDLPNTHAPSPETGTEATNLPDAKKLWELIRSGKHPLSREGVVVHPPTGKPVKVKLTDEHDVHVRETFPGLGKWLNQGVGGFRYSHTPDGPIVGEVGTGLSDELRRAMYQNPQDYVGRVARVRAQERLPSGALRAPALLAMHEDISPPVPKTAAGPDPTPPGPAFKTPQDHRREVIRLLLKAKQRSDVSDWQGKHAILRDLMFRYPDEFNVNGVEGNIAGLSHDSGFRIHIPLAALPSHVWDKYKRLKAAPAGTTSFQPALQGPVSTGSFGGATSQ